MLPKREPGVCLNTYTTTIWGGVEGIRKLGRNRGGPWGTTCLETRFPVIPLGFFHGKYGSRL